MAKDKTSGMHHIYIYILVAERNKDCSLPFLEFSMFVKENPSRQQNKPSPLPVKALFIFVIFSEGNLSTFAKPKNTLLQNTGKF